MSSGAPPSSRASSAIHPSGVARGVLRDSLGSLSNLDQLLGSIRVAPKAVSTVVPDVHAACGPMAQAVDDLCRVISSEPRSAAAGNELVEFFRPRMADVSRALEVAQQEPMNAKQRLALDRVVSRVYPELHAARELLELLVDAIEGPAVRLDLGDVIEQACVDDSAAVPRARSVGVSIATEPSPVELVANPRAVVSLIGHAMSVVAQAKGLSALDVSFGDPGPQVRIRRGASRRANLELGLRTTIQPTRACLFAAAAVLHADLRQLGDGAELRLVWGA